jgi:DNA-binding beta-propeller fold protein YncE
MSRGRHFAVTDYGNHRVSVFSVEGEFVRHVGVGVLQYPDGVASSPFDELVVADFRNHRVVVFSEGGDPVTTMGHAEFRGVAMHGCTLFAQVSFRHCIVFT